MFDTPSSEDNSITVLLPRESMELVPAQSLVRIHSVTDHRFYLGVVIKGPFAEPDGIRGDSPIVVTTTVKGGIFMPKFHGRVQVELLGEESNGILMPPRFRPLPNSPVFALNSEETERVLKVQGDVPLGLAVGHEDLHVNIPADRKSVLPRHVGILGTTGGGKSTTVSGLINSFQKADIATVLIDTEGEYTMINEPTTDMRNDRCFGAAWLSCWRSSANPPLSFECDQKSWGCTRMREMNPMALNECQFCAIIDRTNQRLCRRSLIMPSNANPIVTQIRDDMQALLTYVTGPEAAGQTAYTVELTLFRRLLALGAALLRLFFLTQVAERPAAPQATDGTPLAYYDQRDTTYFSVFGKLSFPRHSFRAPGQVGCCPIDATLSLPARCYSDLLRDWTGYDATDGAYRETASAIARVLGLDLSVQALETNVAADAQDVAAFYAQPPTARDPRPAGRILVVQADGKGVPMIQPPPTNPPLRLGKGQKRTKKKEAIVTCLYTIAPYRRTPAAVRAALLHEERRADQPARPQPIAKELRASLDGKAAAIQLLQQRATLRDGPHILARLALTDGAESLQQQMTSAFPEFTLILDIIHASEYLWATATALLGETHPARTAWVAAKLDLVLHGQTTTVLSQLTQEAAQPTWTDVQRNAIQRTIGYYERNQTYMRYDHYLAQGWPIGTGVVEGACGHLVKDRMEQAGMRWTQIGAQAMRDLRAVRLNGDWDTYWQFHRQQQHQRLYGLAAPARAPEAQVLHMAA